MKRLLLHVTWCCLLASPVFADDGPVADPLASREAAVSSRTAPSKKSGEASRRAGTEPPLVLPSITLGASPQASRRLEAALAKGVAFDYFDQQLADVIDDIALRFNIPIIIKSKKLEECGIDPLASVSINVKQVSLQSALRLMLHKLDLTFLVKDEVLQITTQEHAASMLRSRFYRVSILLSKKVDGKAIVNLITKHVAPDTWNEVGGPGAITFVDHLDTLVVTQTDDVLRQIDTLLASAANIVQRRRSR